MKNKIKKYHIVLMSFMALFIAVFASMFSLRADTVDEETGETDNWEIGIVFYDSTVNDGNTPLTEINWNATSSSEHRTIIMQINYKNTNSTIDYYPGELSIEVPNLIYLIERKETTGCGMIWDPDISAGTSEQGFYWDVIDNYPIIILNNNEMFPQNTNFEGSIQIKYELDPICISNNISKELNATLYYVNEKIVDSNKTTFNFSSNKAPYNIIKIPSPLSGPDRLPENASDYIWVKWEIDQDTEWNEVRLAYMDSVRFEEIVPIDAIVLDEDLNILENNNGRVSIESDNSSDGYSYANIFIGYPKSIYENQTVTNTINSYGIYWDEETEELLATYTTEIELVGYDFKYEGKLYGIHKERPYYDYQIGEYNIKNGGGISKWYIDATAIYTGEPMDIIVGDDLLIGPNTNNTYEYLTDEEYYFKNIVINAQYLKNINGSNIEEYEADIYVRYKNSKDYVKYGETIILNNVPKITFPENQIVGWKIKVYNVQESFIVMNVSPSHWLITDVVIQKEDIASSGKIYNFCYLQVYIDGKLQNEPTLDSYTTLSTLKDIASFDMDTYNTYMQRCVAEINITPNSISFQIRKSDLEVLDFPTEEKIKIKWLLSSNLDNNRLGSTDNFHGITYYDLLPYGMSLESTPEEMISNIRYWLGNENDNANIVSKSGTTFTDKNDFLEYCKKHCIITITENWNNTNRTHIKINFDFSQDPLSFKNTAFNKYLVFPAVPIWTSISYDNYLEYGNKWKNNLYVDINNKENVDYKILKGDSVTYLISDNGYFDLQEYDINENKIIDEKIFYYNDSVSIYKIISTHQDVQTQVKTFYNDFTTLKADSPYNTNYQYKLKINTGETAITNLITYTNLESHIRKYKTDENGYCLTDQNGDYLFDILPVSEKEKWKGTFLSIDTSYVENKGYIVKPYYSTSDTAGVLYNKDGTLNSEWNEFISPIYTNGLSITFSENCSTYNSSDYLYIYYNYNGKTYRSSKYYGTSIAGQTIEIPTTDFYLYWHSNGSGNTNYGFSIDSIEPCVTTSTFNSSGYSLPNITPIELNGTTYPETAHSPYNNNEEIIWHYTGTIITVNDYTDPSLVKSLAFEYLDNEGNPAIIPATSLVYVLVNMKSPTDENITTYAYNGCWTQWTAIDEFDQPVDFITGIQSNIVKVALPNTANEDNNSSISLKFIKEINGTNAGFENMKLDRADTQTFMIRLTSLTANDDGSYDQLTALLKSDQELIISQIPVGTYLLEELGDNYFDFVEFTENNEEDIVIEGVTFERTEQGYIITVSEDLTEAIEFNIKVTNEIEPERFYEDKENKENLFLKNKIEENS